MNINITTTPEFETWWAENGVKMDPPVLAHAFKEVAAKAWNAATPKKVLSNNGPTPTSLARADKFMANYVHGQDLTESLLARIDAFNCGQQSIARALREPTFAYIMPKCNTGMIMSEYTFPQ